MVAPMVAGLGEPLDPGRLVAGKEETAAAVRRGRKVLLDRIAEMRERRLVGEAKL